MRWPGSRPLRINWVLSYSGLSGGVKSNRLIAEAMARRGHDVSIAYLLSRRRWPAPWRAPRRFARTLADWVRCGFRQREHEHHLGASTVRRIALYADRIRPDDVPDADVVIATWWETAEWIADWPASKGLKAYFIRGHELHGGDPRRVAATYRLPYLKFAISRWLQRIVAEQYGDPTAVLVPNGVDWTQFDSMPRSRQPLPTVGLMYSAKQWKGSDTAFEAIRMAQRQVSKLRVVAFGVDAPPADGLMRLSPALGILDQVITDAGALISDYDATVDPQTNRMAIELAVHLDRMFAPHAECTQPIPKPHSPNDSVLTQR